MSDEHSRQPGKSDAQAPGARESGPAAARLAEHYVRCDDPDCPDAYAYRAPFPDAEHWHPRPHGPELPVCLLCGAPGAILCELHR